MDCGPLIHALYFRGRQQSAIWDLYEILVEQGFIKSEGLRLPVDFGKITDAVHMVSGLINCLDLPYGELNAEEPPYEFCSRPFEEPVFWLATMIVRGCSDFDRMFDIIERSEFLDKKNPTAYAQYQAQFATKEFVVKPQERVGNSVTASGPFGFWLPHGLQGTTAEEANARIYPEHIARFNRIEEAFKLWFGIGDDQMVLERNQQACFEEHSEKLPGNQD